MMKLLSLTALAMSVSFAAAASHERFDARPPCDDYIDYINMDQVVISEQTNQECGNVEKVVILSGGDFFKFVGLFVENVGEASYVTDIFHAQVIFDDQRLVATLQRLDVALISTSLFFYAREDPNRLKYYTRSLMDLQLYLARQLRLGTTSPAQLADFQKEMQKLRCLILNDSLYGRLSLVINSKAYLNCI